MRSLLLAALAMIALGPGPRLILAQETPSSAAAEFMFTCNGEHPHPCATVPRQISGLQPEYTEEARGKCFQETVELRFIVGPSGSVQQVEVMKPLGMGLDESAMGAVRTWRFKPGTHDGMPVAVKLSAEVSFSLMTDCKEKKSKKTKPRK